jgi:hypothetical protein
VKSDGETTMLMLTGGFPGQFRFSKKLETQISGVRSGILAVEFIFTG